MKKFYVEIITPEREFFKGECDMLTLPSIDGEETVMAVHEPSVMALVPGTLRIYNDGKYKEASISAGFLEVRPDETILLSEAVEWPGEIDEKRVRENKEIAEEQIKLRRSESEYKLSKLALSKAFARLKVKSGSKFD